MMNTTITPNTVASVGAYEKTPEKVRDLIQREYNFASKYCARVASIHQNAKEEVLALKTKLEELDARIQ